MVTIHAKRRFATILSEGKGDNATKRGHIPHFYLIAHRAAGAIVNATRGTISRETQSDLAKPGVGKLFDAGLYQVLSDC